MAINIGQGNFPILNQQQTNPVMSGLVQALNAHLQMQQGQANRQRLPYVGPQAQAQLQQSQLANKLAQAQLPYAGPQAAANLQRSQLANEWYAPEARAQISQQNATASNLGADTRKTNFMLQNPGLMVGGAPAQISALQLMGVLKPGDITSPQGAPQPQNAQGQSEQNTGAGQYLSGQTPTLPFNTSNQTANAILNQPFAKANLDAQRARGYAWNSLPADNKSYAIAQAAGMGIDPTKASEMFNNGMTIEDIAKQNGFDPNKLPEPDFSPTKGNIGQLKKRQAALAESDVINNFVAQGLGPYAQTFGGMSPKQMSDALTGKNYDQQVNFYAARALAPEAANIRTALAQGQASEGGVNQMMNNSLMNIKASQSFMTPEMYQDVQKLINQKLTDSFNAAEKTYQIGGNKTNSSENPNSSSTPSSASVKLKWVNGQLVEQ